MSSAEQPHPHHNSSKSANPLTEIIDRLRLVLHPARFRPSQLKPQLAWVGPVAIVLSLVVGVLAVRSGTGPEGKATTTGIEWGMSSLILMAWSLTLSTRLGVVEKLFGGVNGLYQTHRWVGIGALVAFFLHKRDPSVAWGYMPFSYEVSNLAAEAAEKIFILAVVLVAVSLVRLIPYNWWRWSHKFFAVVFGVAAWHVVTTPRPFGPDSWAQWFTYAVVALGSVALLYRLVWVDIFRRGSRYRIRSLVAAARWVDLELEPCGKPLKVDVGQSAVLRIQSRGLREPHFFTIASGVRDDGSLRFLIRDSGDWTSRLLKAASGSFAGGPAVELVGTEVLVEGPHGQPGDAVAGGKMLWVAGGVGITPFLSQIENLLTETRAPDHDDSLNRQEDIGPAGGRPADGSSGKSTGGARPLLVWCVRDLADAPGVELVQAAAQAQLIDVEFVVSSAGQRLDGQAVKQRIESLGHGQPQLVHVAVCGPPSFITDVTIAAHQAGAGSVRNDGFDRRGAFGPALRLPSQS